MRLLEFQAKRLLTEKGISTPKGVLVTSSNDLKKISFPTVLKAQVPVGGRGKAGGIRRVEQATEATVVVDKMLASTIKGYSVQAVLAEDPIEVIGEVYVAYLTDKQANMPLLMASSAGGVDIEEVARKTPERIIKKYIDPFVGVQDYELRFLAKALKIGDLQAFADFIRKICAASQDLDATLLEINPLAITPSGLIALDAKILLDDKASYRHQKLFSQLKDEQKKLDRTAKPKAVELAEERQINYVPLLDGNIGVIADGAGTGMLTLDMIYDMGARPANFCEMGGMANAEIMQRTIEVVLADERLKVLVISLIGGLTRMDEMAEGIVRYLKHNDQSIPIVIRMCGTKADVGLPMLRGMGLEAYEDLATTVRTAVKRVKEL
jgi:succinyl-CoA synthetase beta subunit